GLISIAESVRRTSESLAMRPSLRLGSGSGTRPGWPARRRTDRHAEPPGNWWVARGPAAMRAQPQDEAERAMSYGAVTPTRLPSTSDHPLAIDRILVMRVPAIMPGRYLSFGSRMTR